MCISLSLKFWCSVKVCQICSYHSSSVSQHKKGLNLSYTFLLGFFNLCLTTLATLYFDAVLLCTHLYSCHFGVNDADKQYDPVYRLYNWSKHSIV